MLILDFYCISIAQWLIYPSWEHFIIEGLVIHLTANAELEFIFSVNNEECDWKLFLSLTSLQSIITKGFCCCCCCCILVNIWKRQNVIKCCMLHNNYYINYNIKIIPALKAIFIYITLYYINNKLYNLLLIKIKEI